MRAPMPCLMPLGVRYTNIYAAPGLSRDEGDAMGIGSLLFSFAGRINRAKFWLGYLLATVLSLLIMGGASALLPWDQILVVGADGTPVLDELGMQKLNLENVNWGLPVLLFGLGLILSLVMSFALMVKRCHDRGYSGWMSLIALIPVAGGIWMLIALGIMEGERGPNTWGPNPLSNQA